MRRLLALGLATFAMSAAVVNFMKFSGRPSLPAGWFESRTREAKEAGAKLDRSGWIAESPQAERYFWLVMESRDRQKGHDTAAAMRPVHARASGYDAEYVKRMRRMACAELFHDCSDDMFQTYQHIYSYDKLHLSPNDPQLSRDCNNIGLLCFLMGQQSSDDQAARQRLFRQSQQWLEMAAKGTPASAKSDLVSIKENELMLAEGLHDRQYADNCRQQVDRLLDEIHGPAPIVKL